MLRYLAIATVIVLAVVVAATAWEHRDLLRFKYAANHEVGLRGVHERARGPRPANAVTGDAPWALSALPDCVRQSQIYRGTPAFVRSKLPAGASAIEPGARLRFGPCTILVGDGEVSVTRGQDHLRIPPQATLYRLGDGLVLLRIARKTAELRSYDPVKS